MEAALKNLLFRLADDKLIMGHRLSEWTGIGPLLEEDIALSSIAQDEVGHSMTYYQLLTELGEDIPDKVAFTRSAEAFFSCKFVEYPIGDYAYTLMRHYLFDMADMIRLRSLKKSSYKPLADLATKLSREEKYHQMHAIAFLKSLCNSTDEAKDRMQIALNQCYAAAFSLFEPTAFDAKIAAEGIQDSEARLQAAWQQEVEAFLVNTCHLRLPDTQNFKEYYGGRSGDHSEHLAPLLYEMTEVVRISPEAKW